MRALASAWLLASSGALRTERRNSTGPEPPDPWGRDWQKLADGLKFITVDTRSNETIIPMFGIPGISMVNTGPGRPNVKNNKYVYYMEWLQQQDEDTLVVAVDTDVTYGGCDLGLLVREFLRLTAVAQRRVVGGAEFGIFPLADSDTLRRYEAHNEQFLRVHAAFGSHQDAFTRAADCPWYGSPCSDPPQYKFVNSGFFMGQVKDLKRAFGEMLLMADWEDQSNFRDLYFRGADSGVTLDFTGRLCLQMYGLTAKNQTFRYSWREGRLTVNLFDHPVCFNHWNGKARGYAQFFYPSVKGVGPFKC